MQLSETTQSSNHTTKLDVATWASFIFFAVSAVIVGVCLPEISRTFGTNLSEGGGIETARNLSLFIVLLLAGSLAQRWGIKRPLVLGHYLIGAGLLLGSVAQNYAMLVAALAVIGLGGGLLEALLNPVVVALHPRASGKYLNLSHAFYPVGIMASALIFGELLTLGVSWRVIFQIAAAGMLLVAVFYTLLRFPPEERDDRSYPQMFAGILALGGFWLFAAAIFLGASIESAFTFWSRSYVAAYLSAVPRAGAAAVMIFAGAMAAGRFLTAYLANRMALNSIMLGSAVLGLAVSGFIFRATSLWWFYGLLALAGLATACFWPTIMAAAADYLQVNTTILFILLACAGIIGFGLTPWIMGLIGDSSELRAGFTVIPLFFMGLIVVLLVQRRLVNRRAPAGGELVEDRSPM